MRGEIAVAECRTAAEVLEVARRVRERMKAGYAPRPVARDVPMAVQEMPPARPAPRRHVPLYGEPDIDRVIAMARPLAPQMQPEEVMARVAAAFGLSARDLVSTDMRSPVRRARDVTLWMLRAVAGLPDVKIGQAMGRGPTAVASGIARVADRMEADLATAAALSGLREVIAREWRMRQEPLANVDGETADDALKGQGMPARHVIRAIAARNGVTPAQMTGHQRAKPLCIARFEAYWLIDRMFCFSLPKIGRLMGSRDHTTVMHGLKRITRMIAERPELGAALEAIEAELRDNWRARGG